MTSIEEGDKKLPTRYSDAISKSDPAIWAEAWRFEFDSLTNFGTWELCVVAGRKGLIRTQ